MTTTQHPSSINANYRFKHLKAANLRFHEDPPEDIQEAVDKIINAKPTKEGRQILGIISQAFHTGCTNATRAAASEDDFVFEFQNALVAMAPKSLCFRINADWDKGLKPKVQRRRFDMGFIKALAVVSGKKEQEVEDDLAPPPPKRRQLSFGDAGASTINEQSLPANGPVETGAGPSNAIIPPQTKRPFFV
ncbi:MAG: hypothetical protein M1829_004763 [Trizodia sp. TS-e1964]|nr:MAG: hypothetical protein M1829_004763 [Trizodia sp. TS-e1964]